MAVNSGWITGTRGFSQVILLKDIVTGKAGIDYRNEDGKTIWVPVDGFIKKPVDSKVLLPEIKRLLSKKESFHTA
ncbi:MAG: hypothetical protein R2764_13640 [Bacteroidales bacterium]